MRISDWSSDVCSSDLDRVKFELIDYRDLAAREAGRFDRIVSVGTFEHVGAPNFETFFRAAANLMTADGVMLLHTIGRFGRPGSTDAFTRSEEHTSELQSLMRISYSVLCLKKKKN